MKSGDVRVTIEWIQSGQPRPYADSEYIFILFVEWIPYNGKISNDNWEPSKYDEVLIKQYAKAFKHFYEKNDPKREWHHPVLNSCDKIDEGKWKFSIT